MSWEIFVIINLITASLLVPLQRLLLRKEKTEPISFIVVSQLLTGTLLIPFVLVNGFHMPDLSKYGFLITAMFFCIVSGITYTHIPSSGLRLQYFLHY
jgi:hypothetical protein